MILFLSDIAWGNLYQRPQQLAVRLARRERVLWVEPAVLGQRMALAPVEQSPGLFRLTLPAIPFNARNRWIRRAAALAGSIGALRRLLAALQGALLRRACRRIAVPAEEIVCLMENFMFLPLADAVHARRVVFDYIDDVFGFRALPPFMHEAWGAALRRADTITVTSPTLGKRVAQASGREARLVPNGVEFDRFAGGAAPERPGDFPETPFPVVVYIGAIYPWLDFPLMEKTLEALPDILFLFIGSVHPDAAPLAARLSRFRNFRLLGQRPHGEIPGYLRPCHAGIIPFRRSLLTEGVNPVKLYEYSAAGLPAVATDFSDDTRAFADIVLIAHDEAEFAAHIRAAVARRGDAAFRRSLGKFARANDWDRRAEEFTKLIHNQAT